MISKAKQLLKESLYEATKHLITLALLSSVWGLLSGLDDLYVGGNKKCSKASIWHFHPAKFLICKAMEVKGQ